MSHQRNRQFHDDHLFWLLRGGLSTVSHAYHPVQLPHRPELTIGNTPSPPGHRLRCLRPPLATPTGPAPIPGCLNETPVFGRSVHKVSAI